MQRCNCTVRIAGDLTFTTPKANITVAEIAVLRRLHGNDAVIDIVRTKNDKTEHGKERDRLAEFYGAKIIEEMWPGFSPRLPTSLKDIGSLDGAGVEVPEADDTEDAA